MKRFALIALLLGLGFVAGCDKPKAPAVPATPPVEKPATTDDAAPGDKPAEKPADDMPEDEPAK